MDINQTLQMSAALPQSLSKYLRSLLQTPANFGPAQRAFQAQYSHPSLQLGPNGSWLDPSQLNQAYASNYLGERGDIARQDVQDKGQYAGLLTRAGSDFASLINAIPYLQAQNISGRSMFGGLF